jgi:prepilin-type N-terminal cleavage/methylation domain-containing protein
VVGRAFLVMCASRLRRRAAAHEGFTLIEVVVALAVLTTGVLVTVGGFNTSRRLSLVSERHAAMAHRAQLEIERLESIAYSQVGLTSAPSTSTDPTNPDYYVAAGSPPTFQWNRTAGSSETVDVDATNGTVAPVQTWSEGLLSGQVYDFVTWTTDPKCSPGCPATQDYKRITVAVTMAGGLQPNPVYISSVISDPQATPVGGISNGNSGNPLNDPATTCTNALNQTVSCISGIDSGNPNTYFLHDWAATNSGSPTAPSSNHATHATVGIASGLTCTTSQSQASGSNIAGCPVPDLMDASSPPGDSTTSLYNYSSDQGTSGFPGGRLLQPTCSSTSNGCGTGSTSDCNNNGNWTSSLSKAQSEFWVSAPLSATTTFTGDAGISMFTQTLNGAQQVVSFCIEVYDVPPSGSSGSLKDLLAWPPVALGGAGYVAETDPVTGGNWPTIADQVTFTFNYRGSSGAVSVPAGDRIGVRIWMLSNVNNAIDVVYDHPNYPAQVQLNTQ